MAEFPKQFAFPDTVVHITPYSKSSILGLAAAFSSASSSTWPVANEAIYIPFRLSKPITVSTAFYYSGTTATGNFDIGIYSSDGTKIISTGSTAASVTNGIKSVSISATEIGAGQFYLAFTMSSTSGTYLGIGVNTTQQAAASGLALQTTALPLPATATFASVIGATFRVPYFGFTGRSFI